MNEVFQEIVLLGVHTGDNFRKYFKKATIKSINQSHKNSIGNIKNIKTQGIHIFILKRNLIFRGG